MNARQQFEMEAIEAIVAPFRSKPLPSLSDEDKGNEWRAQRKFYEALGVFRSAVQDAQALTDLRKDALGDLLNALSDETPDAIAWSEAISNSQRGYAP